MFCRILCCFVAKSLFYASYAVLSQNLFCRYLRALAWRKIEPKILSVEKKGQISGMPKTTKNHQKKTQNYHKLPKTIRNHPKTAKKLQKTIKKYQKPTHNYPKIKKTTKNYKKSP